MTQGFPKARLVFYKISCCMGLETSWTLVAWFCRNWLLNYKPSELQVQTFSFRGRAAVGKLGDTRNGKQERWSWGTGSG